MMGMAGSLTAPGRAQGVNLASRAPKCMPSSRRYSVTVSAAAASRRSGREKKVEEPETVQEASLADVASLDPGSPIVRSSRGSRSSRLGGGGTSSGARKSAFDRLSESGFIKEDNG